MMPDFTAEREKMSPNSEKSLRQMEAQAKEMNIEYRGY